MVVLYRHPLRVCDWSLCKRDSYRYFLLRIWTQIQMASYDVQSTSIGLPACLWSCSRCILSSWHYSHTISYPKRSQLWPKYQSVSPKFHKSDIQSRYRDWARLRNPHQQKKSTKIDIVGNDCDLCEIWRHNSKYQGSYDQNHNLFF